MSESEKVTVYERFGGVDFERVVEESTKNLESCTGCYANSAEGPDDTICKYLNRRYVPCYSENPQGQMFIFRKLGGD